MSTEQTTEQIPRRIDHARHSEAERAITNAMQYVGTAGCDVALTDAVVLLQAARTRVADFVDGVPGIRLLPREYIEPPVPSSSALAPERIAELERFEALLHERVEAAFLCGAHDDSDDDPYSDRFARSVAAGAAVTAFVADLLASRERFERRVGELESAIKLIVWAFDAAEIADRSDSTPDYVRGIEAAQARLNAAIDAARPVEPPRELSWAEHSLVIARDVPFAGRWYFIGDMAYPYAWTRSVTDARWYETEHVAANDLARGRKADRYAFDGARVEPCPPIIPRATPEPTNG